MDVASKVTELIGETPLVRAREFAPNLLLELESCNPYSVRDRIARAMITAVEVARERRRGHCRHHRL